MIQTDQFLVTSAVSCAAETRQSKGKGLWGSLIRWPRFPGKESGVWRGPGSSGGQEQGMEQQQAGGALAVSSSCHMAPTFPAEPARAKSTLDGLSFCTSPFKVETCRDEVSLIQQIFMEYLLCAKKQGWDAQTTIMGVLWLRRQTRRHLAVAWLRHRRGEGWHCRAASCVEVAALLIEVLSSLQSPLVHVPNEDSRTCRMGGWPEDHS